jgi:hypothetical protein
MQAYYTSESSPLVGQEERFADVQVINGGSAGKTERLNHRHAVLFSSTSILQTGSITLAYLL